MSERKGIDISAWNQTPDFKKLKKAGIEFVMVRLGYGTVLDKRADDHIKAALNAGVHVGVYWFLYATNASSAKDNAAACVKALEKYKGKIDYPVALDFEADSIRYCRDQGGICSGRNFTDMCDVFLSSIEAAGYYAMLYANPSDRSRLKDAVMDKFDWWLAQWSSAPSYKCGIWQYTSSGEIFSGDSNIAYHDYPAILKRKGLNHLTEEKPVKPKTKTITYTVKKGDTLSGICAKYGLNWGDVAEYNNLENPDLIFPGQKIKLKGVKK